MLGPGIVATPKHRSDIIADSNAGVIFFWVRLDMGQLEKIKKKIFEILIFHVKKIKTQSMWI